MFGGCRVVKSSDIAPLHVAVMLLTLFVVILQTLFAVILYSLFHAHRAYNC